MLFELSKDSKDKFASSCTVNKKVKKKNSRWVGGGGYYNLPNAVSILVRLPLFNN